MLAFSPVARSMASMRPCSRTGRASTCTPRSREGTPTCTWQAQVPASATSALWRRASPRPARRAYSTNGASRLRKAAAFFLFQVDLILRTTTETPAVPGPLHRGFGQEMLMQRWFITWRRSGAGRQGPRSAACLRASRGQKRYGLGPTDLAATTGIAHPRGGKNAPGHDDLTST